MINTLQRAFWAQFPEWAQPTNAIYRYVRRQGNANQGWLWRWIRRSGSLGILAGLLTISLVAADAGSPLLMESPGNWIISDVLYLPSVVVQGAAMLIALFATGGAIMGEQRRGTWEACKITSHGADLVIRARWAAVFFQLRWFLALLIGVRLLLLGLILVDLTDYQGYHLDLYIIGITPQVSLEVAVLLLAALLAAVALQFVVLIGLNAALSLLITVAITNRNTRMLVFGVAALAEGAIWGIAMRAGRRVLDADPLTLASGSLSMRDRWLNLLGMGVLGDQGLRLMDLRTALQAWTDVDYGIMIGGALLAAVFAQVMITNGLLILAGRTASRPGRE